PLTTTTSLHDALPIFQSNEFMEALRDRTVKIDIPYITKLNEEVKIYKKDYNKKKIQAKHIAPHTLEMASMWAVLTRLEEPKKASDRKSTRLNYSHECI